MRKLSTLIKKGIYATLDYCNITFVPKVFPDIKAFEFVIPVIPAGSRVVTQLNLGELNDNSKALICFIKDTLTLDQITKNQIHPSGGAYQSLAGSSLTPNNSFPFVYDYSSGAWLNVFESYLDTHLLAHNNYSNVFSDAAALVPLDLGLNYSDINQNCLVGWYSITNHGVLDIDKKVLLQSAWLTQSGNDTILNIAFLSVDTLDSTSKTLKIALYD